ncbi:hypothetical protein BDQ17DRAFT_1348641 [Cyathus striatus]|nr:hypothetical protein BDQ17DRAFT_1348641 [Cyathus striatus]
MTLPTFDELPHFNSFPGCAWGVWGPDDELGTINLLTDEVVRQAAKEEIRTGRTVSLDLPLNIPAKPLFGRISPEVNLLVNPRGRRDDEIHFNTQSGSQWDGLRHFGLIKEDVFYNNIPASSIPRGTIPLPNPNDIKPIHKKLGIQNWATHGISGRGVLLDLVNYYTANGSDLPYDPWKSHPITVPDLEAVARHQGVTFRKGDILFLRVGFMQKYYGVSEEERTALETHSEFAGIEATDDMKRFLWWNNHFAAIASDQPGLEQAFFPPRMEIALHQTIIGLWGMPLGELFDLEGLSKICSSLGRYTFFVSSWPLNIIGGAASPPNAAAYF